MSISIDRRRAEVKRLREALADALTVVRILSEGVTEDVETDERDDYKAKYAELKGALLWGTTCLNCARLLDKSYADYVRANRAETVLGGVVYDLNALADYHETSAESITPSMLRSLAGKYRAAIDGEATR